MPVQLPLSSRPRQLQAPFPLPARRAAAQPEALEVLVVLVVLARPEALVAVPVV